MPVPRWRWSLLAFAFAFSEPGLIAWLGFLAFPVLVALRLLGHPLGERDADAWLIGTGVCFALVLSCLVLGCLMDVYYPADEEDEEKETSDASTSKNAERAPLMDEEQASSGHVDA
jgi:hypothetical protein